MDKSMVQQLNGLASSQLFNRSTFITTAYNEGDYQLRKSRIQNLPSYKKENLSTKLDFVVVFQTIEIERLSTEIQALRVALKDAERQNFNIHNYEIQIRELTQKLHSYEAERDEYFEENERMNIICQKLYDELQDMKNRYADIDPTLKEKYRLERQRSANLEEDIEKWRTRYTALEASKNRQMEDMRLMMESQRKSMVDREIRQLTLRFSSQRNNLENQIRKLREALETKNAEIQRMGNKVSRLQVINQQMRHYEETIHDYENKFAMISQQTIRLNELLRNKQEQIERLANNQQNLKRRFNQLSRQLETEKMGGQRAKQLERVIRQWEIKYSKLESEKIRSDRQLQKIPEFQKMVNQISQETERMKDSIKEKMRDNEELKFRYNKLVNQFQEAQREKQQKIPILQTKIQQINGENDRINDTLKTRTRQLQNWRKKCGDLQRQISKINILQQEKNQLRNNLEDQARQNNQLANENRQLESKLRDFDSVKRSLQQQRQSRQEYIGEIQRLNRGIREMNSKLEEYDRKCANLEKQMQSYIKIEEQLQTYKKQEINFTKQIDRINGIINQKIKEIQHLKEVFKKIQNSINQYQGIEQKMMSTMGQLQKLMQDLDESRKESAFYQEKHMIAEGEIKKIKNQIYIISQEKQQAVKQYNNKSKQFDHLLSESQQIRGQLNVFKQKQARGRQFQTKYRQAEEKLSQLERRLNKQQFRNKEINSQLERNNEQLMKIKREGMLSPEFKQQFIQLKMQNQQKEREIRNFQMRIGQMQNIIKRLKDTIGRNDQINRRNHQKWTNIDKQIDVAVVMVQKALDLQTEIYKLTQQNMKLDSKIKILTVQLDGLNMKKETVGSLGSMGSSSRIISETQAIGFPSRKEHSFGFNHSMNGYSNVTRTTNFGIDRSNLSSKPFKF